MMLRVGVIGALISAACCFTPLLMWVLAPLGVSALTMIYLELGLVTSLVIFSAIAIFAMISRGKPGEAGKD